MAISTNSTIEFFGTRDEVTVASAGQLTAAAYSTAAAVNTWTNDDDAPWAVFTLTSVTFAATASGGQVLNLYAQLVSGADGQDTPIPDADYPANYLCSFLVDGASVTMDLKSHTISLPNEHTGQEYNFFLENATDQTLNDGWSLYVAPKTFGPHA